MREVSRPEPRKGSPSSGTCHAVDGVQEDLHVPVTMFLPLVVVRPAGHNVLVAVTYL